MRRFNLTAINNLRTITNGETIGTAKTYLSILMTILSFPVAHSSTLSPRTILKAKAILKVNTLGRGI